MWCHSVRDMRERSHNAPAQHTTAVRDDRSHAATHLCRVVASQVQARVRSDTDTRNYHAHHVHVHSYFEAFCFHEYRNGITSNRCLYLAMAWPGCDRDAGIPHAHAADQRVCAAVAVDRPPSFERPVRAPVDGFGESGKKTDGRWVVQARLPQSYDSLRTGGQSCVIALEPCSRCRRCCRRCCRSLKFQCKRLDCVLLVAPVSILPSSRFCTCSCEPISSHRVRSLASSLRHRQSSQQGSGPAPTTVHEPNASSYASGATTPATRTSHTEKQARAQAWAQAQRGPARFLFRHRYGRHSKYR